MKAFINRQTSRRWALGFAAVVLSIASAYSFFVYFAQGFVVGDLVDLPGREAAVAVAQDRATYWLTASLFCLFCSTVTTTLWLPFYADASRGARFVGRFVLASILSIALTGLIGLVALSIIPAIRLWGG